MGYFGIGGGFGSGRSRIFSRSVDQRCGRLMSLIELNFLRAWGVSRGSADTFITPIIKGDLCGIAI
jgi:hypothetical protein